MAGSILTACESCGKSFKPTKGKSNKYCQMSCYRVAQRAGKYARGKEHSTRLRPCTNCGKDVVRSLGRSRNGKKSTNVFCNRDCYNHHRAKLIKSRSARCANCDEDFIRRPVSYTEIYCSHMCRVKAKRPGAHNCVNCGTLFSPIKWHKEAGRYVNAKSGKTCTHECHMDWIRNNPERKRKISEAFRGDKHPNWQGGTHYSSYRGAGWVRLRGEIRKRAGYRCEHCGLPESDHGRALEVNHIVPFHQFGGSTELANKKSNLEALCKSCHTKADWKWRKENPVQMTMAMMFESSA